jgi:exonuclease III
MDTQTQSRNTKWTILCHNIRGINSERKWNSIQNKIQETRCDIICIQETKREHFDLEYLKKFTTREFNNFSFIPSSGNSSGTLISWKGSKFHGVPIFEKSFAQSMEFISNLIGQKWILTNIYAPCTPDGKLEFLRWFRDIDMPNEECWIILGDFNLIRRPKRNRPGGYQSDDGIQLGNKQAGYHRAPPFGTKLHLV